MDTLQLIKINQNDLLATLNTDYPKFSKSIKIDLKISQLKIITQKINNDLLNDYIKNGSNKQNLSSLKEESYNLFNILNLFDFQDYFSLLKSKKSPQCIQLIMDSNTNIIPFEILNDGHDFLSDYIIFSRSLIDSQNNSSSEFLIDTNNNFAIVSDPSESIDISSDINDETNNISNIIGSLFQLKGPYKNRHVNKIELIRLLGANPLFHFSGHYIEKKGLSGWKLYDDIFTFNDIQKIIKSPVFLFSNTCGSSTKFFMKFVKLFLDKGAKIILSSIGALPSERATEFSQIFYKYFLIKGYSVGQSFFLSRKEMINIYGKEDLFWCFYQIYGSSLVKVKKVKNINRVTNYNIKNLFFLISLIFLFYLGYYALENNILTEKSKTKKIIINSNIELENNVYNNLQEGSYIKFEDKKYIPSSIYFNNKEPLFCDVINFKAECGSKKIIINSINSIEPFYYSNNDTLNISFYNKDDYKKIHFDYRHMDIELYVENDSTHLKTIYLFDKNNACRYKIPFKELVQLNNLYEVITRNEIEKYIGNYYTYGSSFHKNIKFDYSLVLYVKKALIE